MDGARALFVLATEGAHDALGLGDAMRSALRKVMAAAYQGDAERTSRRILVDPARWMRGTETSEDWDLGALQHAVFTDRRLLLTYRSGDVPQTYAVDPYGLVSKAGVWYLVADRDAEWCSADLTFEELPDVRGLLAMGGAVEVTAPPTPSRPTVETRPDQRNTLTTPLDHHTPTTPPRSATL